MNKTIDKEIIQQLITKRDNAWFQHTSDLLKILKPSVLDAVEDYFNRNTAMEGQPDFVFKWEDAAILNDVLVIFGMAGYPLGFTFPAEKDEHGDIIITEENKEHFQQVVKIGIPMEIVYTADRQGIYDMLQEVDTSSMDVVVNDEPRPSSLDKSYSADLDDFDLELLDEHQLKALNLTNSGDKNN